MPQDNNKRWGLLAATGAIALTLILVVVGLVARQKDSPANNPSAASPAPATTTSEAPKGKEGEWLDPTADVFGRAIKVPANGAGNPLGNATGGDTTNCAVTAGNVTIESTHGAQTMWTEKQGPSSVNADGVPTGYARTAEGAMISGFNTVSLIYAGGPISGSAAQYGAAGSDATGFAERLKANPPKQVDTTKDRPAPSAYKVTSCSDTQVVGDIALPTPTDAQGNADNPTWLVIRLSMVWENGGWKWQYEGVPQPIEDEITSLSGWTEWHY
ncbi:hypothetical protein [Corynebacterium mucifaciens]|uniref:DUF8175 domain-containing protein n=1 Tax=Corynebacterium mucifaciens TaxID=57171 RepID=A0A7X6LSI8_9CORY|nr:hypothetical protein [Corynebacterium mucifaciens]NKY69589.1 hypothetical protein [Corynebacterium mucifaciens]